MSLSVGMVTVDCTDPHRLAEWWASALGGSVTVLMPDEFVLVSTDTSPALGFQRVDDPTPGKNRVHLDLATTADLDAEVSRLTGLGATETARHTIAGGYHWVVLADPAGNAFCVVAATQIPSHQTHPHYAERHEPAHPIVVNGGPVLKVHPNLRYATGSRTAAAFELACRQAGVPLQRYEHRADLP